MTNKQAIRRAAWILVQREMLENGVFELRVNPGTLDYPPYASVTFLDGRVEAHNSAYEAFNAARAR